MNFVIIDVETTGGSVNASKITELAIYKFDGEKIIDEFVTLVNPEIPIPEFIVRLTGISDHMVAKAPKFYEIAKKVIEFCEGCVFVAHNVAFDYGMFRSEFKTLGYDFRFPHLCTVKAARLIIPGHESYSLGKLTRSLGISINGRHRAGGDALATAELFQIMHAKDQERLIGLIQTEINPKKIHPNLSIETIDGLPQKTGVYLFYNEFNKIIYIGKSISIKKRVEQHLNTTKTAKAIKMIQDIVRIEYEITGSDLIAMLRESELIKIHKPLYNRTLRNSVFSFGLFDQLNERGYITLKIESLSKNDAYPLIHFNSKKEGVEFLYAKVEHYQLCQKLCHLYQSQESCFHYTIKKCSGACVNVEHEDDYNKRVNECIDALTFEGRSFYIIDKGREKIEKSVVWIENGVYQGYGFAPYHFHGKGPTDYKRYINKQKENRDVKTILTLFLRKNESAKVIEL